MEILHDHLHPGEILPDRGFQIGQSQGQETNRSMVEVPDGRLD
jgi:hypothetical protein